MNPKITDSERELLANVRDEKEFFTTLSKSEESVLLRDLSVRGLVKWCPYPEEFYIITIDGENALKEYSDA